MVRRQQRCRYCNQLFAPAPGKPGYIDECPECLHEKTTQRPEPETALSERQLARAEEVLKAVKEIQRVLRSLGFSKEEVNRRMALLLTATVTESSADSD